MGVEGVLGIAGGWVRWASDGRSGEEMELSDRRGLLEVGALPFDCQGSSSREESVPDIRDDAVDVCESSLGGLLVDDDRLLASCFDDRLDPLGSSKAKLRDDFLRVRFTSSMSASSWYLSSSTSPIVFSSSLRSSVPLSPSFPALPLVIKYTPKNVKAQPPKNFPNRLASAS